MKKLIAFLLLSLLVTSKTFATCILILLKDKVFYIAADSKRSFVNSIRTQTICKIHNCKKVYFAISGHDDKALYDCALASLTAYKNVNSAISNYETVLKTYYKKSMDAERINNPLNYDYYLNNELAVVSFFGFRNSIPFLTTLHFSISHVNLSIQCLIENSTSPQLGFCDHLNSMSDVDFKNKITDKRGAIYTLENCIKYEITFHPDIIGAPIDLLELTDKGEKWISPKRNCEVLL